MFHFKVSCLMCKTLQNKNLKIHIYAKMINTPLTKGDESNADEIHLG